MIDNVEHDRLIRKNGLFMHTYIDNDAAVLYPAALLYTRVVEGAVRGLRTGHEFARLYALGCRNEGFSPEGFARLAAKVLSGSLVLPR
jgi:hypothetical protein